MNPLAQFLCFCGVCAAAAGSPIGAALFLAAALVFLVLGAQPPRLP